MKKILLVSAILLSSSNMAHAGFFDFLFGNKEDEKEPVAEATAPQPSPAAATTPAQTAPASTLKSVTDMAVGLVPFLTSELNVTKTQAQGGMGSLLQLAQSALSSGEFNQLSQGIPGMETLLAAAPVLGSKSAGGNAMTGMLANVGGMAAGLGSMGKLTQQFEALGLSPEMIIQFATIAIDYFSKSGAGASEGGNNTGALLEKGLSAIFGQQQ